MFISRTVLRPSDSPPGRPRKSCTHSLRARRARTRPQPAPSPGRWRSSLGSACPAAGPVGAGQAIPGHLSSPLAQLDGERGLPPQRRVPDDADRPGPGRRRTRAGRIRRPAGDGRWLIRGTVYRIFQLMSQSKNLMPQARTARPARAASAAFRRAAHVRPGRR